MSHFSENIINKIKSEKIKPIPRWVFILKYTLMWGLFVFSALLGSLAVGIILFQVRDVDWDIYSQAGNGLIEYSLLALPYFWILLMVLFLGLACFHFRRVKKGYRYSGFVIIGGSFMVSCVLGGVLYTGGFSEELESIFLRIPHYEDLHLGKRLLWQRPDRGFLAGTVQQAEEGKVLILQDFNEQAWWVDIKDAMIRPGLILSEGTRIKVVGKRISNSRFIARAIAPWRREGPRPFGGIPEKRPPFSKNY